MSISNPLRGERKAGTVGKPFPGVEVSRLSVKLILGVLMVMDIFHDKKSLSY